MLERGINVVVAEGVRAVWVAVLNPETGENELTLMPAAALTNRSIVG